MSDEDAQKAAKYRKKMMILIGLGSAQMFFALFVCVFFPDRTDRLGPIFFFLAFFLLSLLSDCYLGRLVFIWNPAQPDSDGKAKDQDAS